MRLIDGRAGAIALGAFLVLDVLLVAAALSSTGGAVAGGGTVVGSADLGAGSGSTGTSRATSGTPTTRTPSTTTTPSTSTASVLPAAPLTVGVVAIGPSTALRFTTGTCRDSSTLQLTRDRGASWSARSKPFDSVLRIRMRSDGSAFALGTDGGADCTVALSTTSAYDGSWAGASSASASWYRDPGDATRIHRPTARTSTPCGKAEVVDLSVTDSGARVLCADGRLRTSTSGTKWSTAATIRGALALAQSPQGTSYVALPGVAGCEGIAVVTAAAPSTPLGCARADLSGVAPGSVALSVSPDSGWLLVGDDVFTSNGSLRSWKQS